MRFILLFVFSLFCYKSSNAQSYCDSLEVQVAYHPFFDSLLEIRVHNQSQHFFNYPAFVVLNANNDTVAKEVVNLFGIGQYSIHVANISPAFLSAPDFSGTLQLYEGFFDTLSCSFPYEFKLCPTTCKPLTVSIANYGSASVTGSVKYELRNALSQVVKSGMLTLDNLHQQTADTACLMPGAYNVRFFQNSLSQGGNKTAIITQDSATFPYLTWDINQFIDTSFGFDFYKKCTSVTSVNPVISITENPIKISVKNGILSLQNTSSEKIENALLISMDGKIVNSRNAGGAELSMDVSGLATGIYVVQVRVGKKVWCQCLKTVDWYLPHKRRVCNQDT